MIDDVQDDFDLATEDEDGFDDAQAEDWARVLRLAEEGGSAADGGFAYLAHIAVIAQRWVDEAEGGVIL